MFSLSRKKGNDIPLGWAGARFDPPPLRARRGTPYEHKCTGIRRAACATGDTCAPGDTQARADVGRARFLI
eukprot:11942286-Alexandrium_andersonii.AAC.1